MRIALRKGLLSAWHLPFVQGTAFLFLILLYTSLSRGSTPTITNSVLSPLVDSSYISDIYQDKNGLLWIGTHHGLYRYDGSNLIRFHSQGYGNTRIPGSDISSITEDREGSLLVATFDSGLLVWNQEQRRFLPDAALTGAGYDRISNILVTNNGDVWISSRNGLHLRNPKTPEEIQLNALLRDQHFKTKPNSLVESPTGEILAGSEHGILAVSKSLIRIDKKAVFLDKNTRLTNITALKIGPNRDLYVGNESGHIARLDSKTLAVKAHIQTNTPNPTYISELEFLDDLLAIGTDHGLLLSTKNLNALSDVSNSGKGLSNPYVNSLFSSDGHIWIGTYGGIDLLKFSPFSLFSRKNTQLQNDITSFEEDEAGNLWVGTYRGLYYSPENSAAHLFFDQGLIDSRVSSLLSVQEELWIGYFQNGLQILDPQSGKLRIPSLENAHQLMVTSFLQPQNSPWIWIGTYNQGLIKYDSSSQSPTQRYLETEYVLALYETDLGHILASASGEFFIYRPNLDDFSKIALNWTGIASSPEIYSIAQGPQGQLWLGTRGYGLFLVQSERKLTANSTVVAQSTALTSTTVYAIEVDEQGNLWCSTDNGIAKLNSGGEFVARFTKADGLQDNDFELGASFKNRSGTIFFGGLSGYNSFHPDDIAYSGDSDHPFRLIPIT